MRGTHDKQTVYKYPNKVFNYPDWVSIMAHTTQTSFGDALFSGTRQKVLGLLFGQPKQSFLLTELIQKANSGSGSVQREVERLTSSGLVSVTQHGRQKSYQANPNSPIYHELIGLVEKTLGPAAKLQSLLENRHEIELAILYGSVAKNRDTAMSDIDLLLVTDALTLDEAFKMLEPLEKELARVIHPTVYTTSEFTIRLENNNPFLTKLLSGEHQLLKGHLSGKDAIG